MNKTLLPLSLLLFLAFSSCMQTEGPQVMTVAGPVPASEIGVTLVHEHVLVDFIGADSTGYHRWNRQDVIEKVLPHLNELQSYGCRTLIECTPAYVGRDPELLRKIAGLTGLNILTNTGLYGAFDNKFIPARASGMSAEKLAVEWIDEYRNGIEDSGIRPGFIKIAVDISDSLSRMHEKIIRAAGLTSLETGLVIKSHTCTDEPAFNQLAVLEELGIPAERFIWTHAQHGTQEGRIRAARMGAWISLDNIRSDNIDDYVAFLQEMKAADLLEHVLISHDAGWYSAGVEGGGSFRSYTTIFREFLPALRNVDFTEAELEQIMVDNPARAFRLRI
jgi:phosphotriesterase-related protein